MARGFLSGILWGGSLGLGAVAVVSVLAPMPNPPEITDAAPSAVRPTAVAEPTADAAVGRADQALATGQTGQTVPQPEPDTLSTLDSDTTETAAQPQAGAAEDLSNPEAAATQNAGVSPSGETPVAGSQQGVAPAAPQAEGALAINTEPAAPPAPGPSPVQGSFDDPAQPEAEAPVAAQETEVSGPLAPAQPKAEDSVDVAALAPQAAEQPAGPSPAAPQAPETPEAPDAPQAPAVEADPDPETADAAAPAEAEEASAQEGSNRPRIGQLAGSLTDRDTGVVIRRPGSGTLGQVDDGVVSPDVAEDSAAEPNSNLPPVKRFAASFENPDAKPLMGIVLIDDGASPVAGAAGIAALDSFPYPLSFAVDTSLEDAAERMQTYRAAGFEVLAMIDLPDGARPADAETTLGVILSQMTEVVGVLEGTQGGLQGTREVADQVTAILGQSGHGLLTQNRGLNTMPKLARKEGVPADPVFRDFDSKGQSAQVIRRFLDQAAFKAGQEGAVVMLGRLRPDTISALLLWGLQDRAGKVALAPISAVLLREQQ